MQSEEQEDEDEKAETDNSVVTVVTVSPAEKQLSDLKVSMRDTQPVGSLVQVARSLDQARAVLTFVEAIADKTLRSTVVLTAAR